MPIARIAAYTDCLRGARWDRGETLSKQLGSGPPIRRALMLTAALRWWRCHFSLALSAYLHDF